VQCCPVLVTGGPEVSNPDQLRLLRAVLDHTTDAVLIAEAGEIDLPGPRIVYVNEAFVRKTGYTSGEVLGRTPRILQGPRTDRRALDRIREAMKAWQSVEVEVVNYCRDGTPFLCELSISPVADERGWFTHWVAVQRDVTHRRRLALELEHERAALLELSGQDVPLAVILQRLERSAARQFGDRAVRVVLAEEPGGVSSEEVPGEGAWGGEGIWRCAVTGGHGRVLGELQVASERPDGEEDRVVLGHVARLAALLIERDRDRAALRSALSRAETLALLGDVLQQAVTPSDVTVSALAQFGPALSAQSMLVVPLDGIYLQRPTVWGDVPEAVMRHMTRPGLTLAQTPALQEVARRQEALYLRDDHAVPGALPDLPALGYGVEPLCAPGGAVLGFLIAWRAPGEWHGGERTLMRRAAGTISLALERADQQARLEVQREQQRLNALHLQQERGFLSTVLSNLSEAVIACDGEGRLTLFNDAARLMHGLDVVPLLPDEWAAHFDLFGADGVTPLAKERVPLYRALQGERFHEAQMVIRARDGMVRHLLVSGQPLRTPDGVALGAVVTMRDDTACREIGQITDCP